MFFKKEKQKKCHACGSKCSDRYSYCPHCGSQIANLDEEIRDFGMLGKNDVVNQTPQENSPPAGFTDRILDSLIGSMMRSINKQMREQLKDMENAEIQPMPNGVRIRIGGPGPMPQANQKPAQIQRRVLTEDQMKKMGSLPRTKAKTNVKRIGDKILYELATPDVISPADVFISKLESGYEIKAIGNKNVYINSIPINLPIRRYSVVKNRLVFEFNTQE